MPRTAEPTATDIAARLLVEHAGAILTAGRKGELPAPVVDATTDLRGALEDVIAAGVQLEADRAELTLRRDLMPPDGFRRLWQEANEDATSTVNEAQRAADRAYQRLEESLREAALPTMDPARETLARDEAMLALSGPNPEPAALNLAEIGNPEAVAALLSPWGSTLLRSRGVRDPDRVLRDVRKVAVARAIDRNETPAARAIRENLAALGAAKGSAGSTVRRLTR